MTFIERAAERIRHPALSETDVSVVRTMIAVGSHADDIARAFGYTERQVQAVVKAVCQDAMLT